jgi:hypothetical protein
MASDSKSFLLKKPDEAKTWNENADPQCIPIWNWVGDTGVDIGAWLTYGNQDLVPKCSALPQAVLGSQYTVETYTTCELEARQYKYVSPFSKTPTESSYVTKNDPWFISKPSLNQKPIPKMSTKCERFRQVIDGICDTCAVQAKSPKVQEALQSQCKALQDTVPTDIDPRAGKWFPFQVVRRGMPWKAGEGRMFTRSAPDVIGVPTTALITAALITAALLGLFMGVGVISAMHRRRASTAAHEPLLATNS